MFNNNKNMLNMFWVQSQLFFPAAVSQLRCIRTWPKVSFLQCNNKSFIWSAHSLHIKYLQRLGQQVSAWLACRWRQLRWYFWPLSKWQDDLGYFKNFKSKWYLHADFFYENTIMSRQHPTEAYFYELNQNQNCVKNKLITN